MLPADGVAAGQNLPVGLPALADLVFQLFLDNLQWRAFDAAEPRGLVLYAEQERVLGLDG